MRRTKALRDEIYAYAVGRLEEAGTQIKTTWQP